MVDVIKIMYLLLLTAFLYFLVYRTFIRKDPFERKEWVLTLFVLGLSLVLYVRFILHDLILLDPSDEALYVALGRDILDGKDPPTSGPGFLYAVLFIHSQTDWPIENIMAVIGIIIGAAYPFLLYLVYRKKMASREEAVITLIFIFSTSYLLWPMIEARPQQAGMVLVLIGGLLYQRFLEDGKHLAVLVPLLMFTFIFHILSFLILMGLVFLLWWIRYIEGRTDLGKVLWPALVAVFGFAVFIGPFAMYSGMFGGVRWTIGHSHLSPLMNGYLLTVVILALVPLSIFLTGYLRRVRIIEKAKHSGQKNWKILRFLFIAVLVVGLIGQFVLNRDVHIDKYKGSVFLFLVLQSGNLIFGGLFIFGFFKAIKEGDFDDPFFRSVFLLMLIGAASLLVSLFLPVNFNNWTIRMINYWTLFAAPVVGRSLLGMNPRWRHAFILLLPVLVVLSLVNISRDQAVLGFP